MKRVLPNHEALGFLPDFVFEDDPRPAAEQFHDRYAHGGGWRPMEKWKFDEQDLSIKYPGDPKLMPLASGMLHGKELIVVYPGAWVAIIQEDKSFEVSRMD